VSADRENCNRTGAQAHKRILLGVRAVLQIDIKKPSNGEVGGRKMDNTFVTRSIMESKRVSKNVLVRYEGEKFYWEGEMGVPETQKNMIQGLASSCAVGEGVFSLCLGATRD